MTIKPLGFCLATMIVALLTLPCLASAQQDDDPTLTQPQPDPPSRVGRLSFINGGVSLRTTQDDDWHLAELNRPMVSGDQVFTADDGRAEIHFGSTAIRLRANTTLKVHALSDQTLELHLEQGSALVYVHSLDKDDVLDVILPEGEASLLESGLYRIDAGDSLGHPSRITVRQGAADVFMPDERSRIGEGTTLAMSEPLQTQSLEPRDEFERWAAERDNRAEHPESLAYVSRETIGYEDLDEQGRWQTTANYGSVWYPSTVPANWAPYRFGHWVYVAPWGWTWIDDQPWGFAPFHYGRWVHVNNVWGWAPGPIVRRPIYAPALVAFVDGYGPNVSTSLSAGGIGWFPLGFNEPYYPCHYASHSYITGINRGWYSVTRTYTRPNYVYRGVSFATTVVPRPVFFLSPPDRSSGRRRAARLLDSDAGCRPPICAPNFGELHRAKTKCRDTSTPCRHVASNASNASDTPAKSPVCTLASGTAKPRARPAPVRALPTAPTYRPSQTSAPVRAMPSRRPAPSAPRPPARR